MNLHHNQELFTELITAASQKLNLREVLIEKDYWVTYVLKNLSENDDLVNKVVFKGGTSLSKAYKAIDRFSEDIDLALITNKETANQIKTMIRATEKGIVGELIEVQIEGITSKFSKYRKTVYEYPKNITNQEFGQATDKILIEINSFTSPVPYSKISIQSYAKDFLDSIQDDDTVVKYGLGAFELNVLSIQRTFIEKLMGVIRLSYQDQRIDKLQNKVRHLYDLHMMIRNAEIQELISSKKNSLEIIRLVKADDSNNHEFMGEWLKNKLTDSPFFVENLFRDKLIRTTYNSEFKRLVFGELPSIEDIAESLEQVKNTFKNYSI